jgi:hypothetical protein
LDELLLLHKLDVCQGLGRELDGWCNDGETN